MPEAYESAGARPELEQNPTRGVFDVVVERFRRAERSDIYNEYGFEYIALKTPARSTIKLGLHEKELLRGLALVRVEAEGEKGSIEHFYFAYAGGPVEEPKIEESQSYYLDQLEQNALATMIDQSVVIKAR